MKQSDGNLGDDRLARFADQILAGKSVQLDPDEELRGLEETILRLNRAIPRTELDAASLRKLESRLAVRLRQEQEQARTSFWKQWLNGNWRYGAFRPQAAATIGLLVVLTVAVLIALELPMKRASVAATALTTGAALTVIMLAGVIATLIWINRRK